MKPTFFIFLLWLLAAPVFAQVLQPGPVAEWKISAGGNGHFYQAIYAPNGVDWYAATAYATTHNGYLATLTSAAENQFAFNLVDDPKFWGFLNGYREHNLGPWLGGQRRPGSPRPEDNWFWIHDGTPFTYTNWAKDQPDAGGFGGENYLQFFSDDPNIRAPTWNDVGPEYQFNGLVVEYDSKPTGATSGSDATSTATPAAAESSSTDPQKVNTINRNLNEALPDDSTFADSPVTGPIMAPVLAPAPVSPQPSAASSAANPFAPAPPTTPTTTVSATTTTIIAEAKVEWPLGDGGNGHYYQAVSTPGGITWDDAQQYALTHGGYLATIGSKEENDFVFKLVDDPKFWRTSGSYADGPWLGGVKTPGLAKPGEGWHWVNDGSAFTYTNWAPPNPGNPNGDDDRLIFWTANASVRQSTWNDRIGHAPTLGFVIEFDADPAPGSLKYRPFAALGALGLLALIGVVVFFRHKYKATG